MSKNNLNKSKVRLRGKIILIIFGFFLTVIILEAGLRLGGFILKSLQENRNRVALKRKGTCRIMCLGESTTFNQYPRFLENALNQREIGIKFSVIDKGEVGASTSMILARLESRLDAYHPDIVITMMGINDRGRHLPYAPVSDSAAINFLKSSRVYKLTRLLWLHIATNFREIVPDKLSKHSAGKLKKQIELGPGDAEAYLGLGGVYRDQCKFPEAQELFKKAIELSPGNAEAYLGLGGVYREQSRHFEAQELFKKAIELSPGNAEAYLGLGQLYRDQCRFPEAEESLKRAIELNPQNDRAYTALALLYEEQYRFPEAEELLKKAIKLNPKNIWAFVELSLRYQKQGRFSEVEELLKEAIEVNPGNPGAYSKLALFYRSQRRLSEFEDSLKEAIKFNPGEIEAYATLAWFYQDQGRLSEAQELLKKTIELNSGNVRIYATAILKILYEAMGNPALAREYCQKAKELGLNYYHPSTTNNYHQLKAILDKRGIAYVCAQYPMRAVDPLKKIFQDEKGIIFVDNEQVFKDAVIKDGYCKYFDDMFGGDFGHCTPEGNKLLAENIANVILKEVFSK